MPARRSSACRPSGGAELGQAIGGHGESDREGMSAETREEIAAGLDRLEQRKAIDGSAGAVGDAVFDADHDGRLGGALDHARSENADDAAMPAVAVDHEQAVGGEVGVVGEARFNGGERRGFGVAALAIEPLKLGGELGGAAAVAGGEQLDDF